MSFNTIDLNNINHDDNNFDDDYPETLINVRLLAFFKEAQKG